MYISLFLQKGTGNTVGYGVQIARDGCVGNRFSVYFTFLVCFLKPLRTFKLFFQILSLLSGGTVNLANDLT